MPSLSDLRRKKKSIISTQKITKAMKLVAGARFNRAQTGMNAARIFERELQSVFSQVLGSTVSAKDIMKVVYGKRPPEGKTKSALVVISGDKGLCGDFNNSTLRVGDHYVRDHSDTIAKIFSIGKKSCDHYRKYFSIPLKEYSNVFTKLEFSIAETIATELLDELKTQELTEIVVIGSSFKSMMRHEVITTSLLPFVPEKTGVPPRDIAMEPADEEEFIAGLVPMYIKAKIYCLLRESYAAELAARIRAMDNATTNAKTLIEDITLEMNKVRQAEITKQIAEIIGTNEVVK